MTLFKSPSPLSNQSDTPVLQIPFDGKREFRTFQVDTLQVSLDDTLNQKLLQRVGHDGGAIDPLSLFLTVYVSWIYRLSGENDIRVGTSGGLHSALVPIQVSMQENDQFQKLRHAITKQLATPILPEDSFIDTIFVVNEQVEMKQPFLLGWHIITSGNQWNLQVSYDKSLWKETTIQRYIHIYNKLLEAALDNEYLPIGAVPILSYDEIALYQSLNDTAFEYPRNRTMHQLFEDIALAHGERPALSSLSGIYSYKSLNEKANQVARLLLNKGLHKGDFVAIFMERSLETIISILGILKAGGVYVPVDPEYPQERISYMMEDTNCRFMLTKAPYLEKSNQLGSELPATFEIMLVDEGLDCLEKTNPEVEVQPEDLAYIIYTSGSTGKPKGTLLAHEGVVNLGTFIRHTFQITEHDVLTQFATFSFDASVWETISALFSGAHLVLLGAEERISVEAFADAVERTRATIIPAVPTVFFNQLAMHLSEEGYRKLSTVKQIMTAGEALYGEQVRAFQRKCSEQIDIYNLYGPTECTVGATFHRVSGLIPEELTHIPIGKPNGNYRVYIVNEEQQLCPIHVPGELYISTIGLAKGYLNQPDKTASAFTASPFAADERVYRTGDIVKLLEDGTIEYVTRRDSQIKIRGHRIEIGAIEDSFAKFPNVHSAAVIPRKDNNGQNMLVGYFTSMNGSRIEPTAIKKFLNEKLPAYYVPRSICQLETMPLSPTGKIERKLLATFELIEEQEQLSASYAALTELQQQIAAAWKDVLGVQSANAQDDFFLIGGDSLDVIQVLVHLKPLYPALTINDLFQYKTMEQLATRMEQVSEVAATATMLDAKLEKLDHQHAAIKVLNEHPVIATTTAFQNQADTPPANVLLTGASGYLGSHILYEVLIRSHAQVHALVRNTSSLTGMDRLQEIMTHYFGEDVLTLMEGRVHVLEGNLEQPRLGLQEADYTKLSQCVQAIFHAAADVRHFGDNDQFDRTNVQGTRHLLELAESRKGIRFHHVSTISVPEDLAHSGHWDEVELSGEMPSGLHLANVYSDSKLQAEKLVLDSSKRGLAVTLYRPGNLTCHSENGRFQRNIDSNSFYRMIKAMLLLGKAPKANWYVDFTPIDYGSKAMVELAFQPETIGQVLHICNPNQILYTDLIQMINACGYPVETMDFASYTKWLLDPTIPKDRAALQLAMAQLEGDGAKDSIYQYGCPATSAFLAGTSVSCKEIDLTFIQSMIAYAVNIEYFPKPSNVSSMATLF
ncbi:amino acid adenylation domain-containing protein [Paenibacillus sp. SYP-B3998]|uniref:Amino acid adenylation domain-containing protein n=1 Tax=Paenibacillus sp. SYP-B3998 TaxID=2678564 RepID=A0A6G3ZZQ6_9BACL|nr:non-ribosomal peptide synthetase [Paenibacillus sp. SYP-B3998]NEW07693.1 amino acid adenylation domain-containing protein [Paenibacillus sp. SYP-B3998]